MGNRMRADFEWSTGSHRLPMEGVATAHQGSYATIVYNGLSSPDMYPKCCRQILDLLILGTMAARNLSTSETRMVLE